MSTSDYLKSSLATLLWNQDRSNHLQGLAAIGSMIRNRVTAGWGSYSFVIDNHERWSPCPNNERYKLGDVNDILFIRLLGVVDSIFSGLEKDVTVGALWGGCRLDQITSQEFLENIVRKTEAHPRIAQVGQLVFFK